MFLKCLQGLPVHLFLDSIKFSETLKVAPILQRGWLVPDTPLHFLQLKSINVLRIREHAFSGKQFQNLRQLKIEDASIRCLYPGAFNGLLSLTSLSLISLQIISIKPNALRFLPNLHFFKMKNCFSKQLNLDGLFGALAPTSQLDNIIEIEIERCNLGDTITASTFNKIKNVKILRLSSNQIQSIGERSFDNTFQSLQRLILDSNKLTWLPANLFPVQTDRQIHINLNDNPWHCDTKMEGLRQLVRRKDTKLKFTQFACRTPSQYADKALSSLLQLKRRITTSLPVEKPNLLLKPPHTAIAPSPFSAPAEMKDYFAPKPKPIEVEDTKISLDVPSIDEIIQQESIEDQEEITWEPETDKMVDIQCKVSIVSELSVTLTQPLFQQFRVEHKNRFINTKTFLNHPLMLHFEQFRTGDSKNILKCKNIIKNVQNTIFDLILKPNRMQRVCIMDKSLKTITPLNCLQFFLFNEESDLWLLVENRSMMIVTFILFGISGLVLGILIPLGLATFFPIAIRWIQYGSKNKNNCKTMHGLRSRIQLRKDEQ